MKFKTSPKELKEKVPERFLWKCGYCDLQHLFNGTEPVAYSSGKYGWNFDVYKIGSHYVTTGYRNMVGERIPDDILNKYEKYAEKLVLEHRTNELEIMLKDFENELYVYWYN